MQRTHDLGRLFVVFLRVKPKTRWISYAPTWEVDNKFRFGPTVVFRLGRRGVGIGWWLDTSVSDLEAEREARHAEEAEQAAYDAYVAVNGTVPREQWAEVRRNISQMDLDPDEEMAIMQENGVFS